MTQGAAFNELEKLARQPGNLRKRGFGSPSKRRRTSHHKREEKEINLGCWHAPFRLNARAIQKRIRDEEEEEEEEEEEAEEETTRAFMSIKSL